MTFVKQKFHKMETVKLISSATLKSWLETSKKVSIVDIRPGSQRSESSITESIHVEVYDKLKQNDSSAFDNLYLDKSIPVVTFCGGGEASIIAVEMLALKGYDAFSLEGGHTEWNQFTTNPIKPAVL
jgi:rhodanese-related sulfurtransferase